MTQIRDRVTQRVTKTRLILQARRSVRPFIVYAAGLAVAAACGFYVFTNLPGDAGLQGGRQLRLIVAEASGVVPDRSEIRVKGIPAGTVTESKVENGRAVVTALVDEEYGRIYRDARIVLRPNTALQDMYLDVVDRGTPAAGEVDPDEPLPPSRTKVGVHIADILNTFEPRTRASLRRLMSDFGIGLEDRGDDLQTAFVELVPMVTAVERLSSQLSQRAAKTRRLVHNTRLLTAELGRRDAALRRLLGDGGVVLRALQSSAGDLDSTLRELSPAMFDVESTFTSVRDVLPDVDRALTSLGPVAERLPSVLPALRRIGDGARPAVVRLRPAVRQLNPLVHSLRPLTSHLSTSIRELRPQAGAYDRVTRTLAACEYTLARFFHWTHSVFQMGDARGVAPRGDAAYAFDAPGFTGSPRVSEAPTCGGGSARNGRQEHVIP